MRKLIGVALYFIGIGFWVFCVFWMIPPLIVIALATYAFGTTQEWPAFKYHWIWKYVRERVFNFTVEGNFPDYGNRPVIWAIYPHGHFSLAPVFYWALNERFRNAKAAIHSCL
jgi:hypothetical protein